MVIKPGGVAAADIGFEVGDERGLRRIGRLHAGAQNDDGLFSLGWAGETRRLPFEGADEQRGKGTRGEQDEKAEGGKQPLPGAGFPPPQAPEAAGGEQDYRSEAKWSITQGIHSVSSHSAMKRVRRVGRGGCSNAAKSGECRMVQEAGLP